MNSRNFNFIAPNNLVDISHYVFWATFSSKSVIFSQSVVRRLKRHIYSRVVRPSAPSVAHSACNFVSLSVDAEVSVAACGDTHQRVMSRCAGAVTDAIGARPRVARPSYPATHSLSVVVSVTHRC